SIAVYDLPMGYIGRPDFTGFHNLMKAKGFDKPVWINETGVAVWEGGGQNGPGRATADEQANFVLQSFAYGIAAGVQRIFIFQLYDDGAGALDPSGKPAEFYGLIDNNGKPRPAYRAYQTAAHYLANFQAVTRVNTGRNGDPNVKGIEAITLYGTSVGKVTIAWNNDGGGARELKVAATMPKGSVADKLDQGKDIQPRDGFYTLSLPPATN